MSVHIKSNIEDLKQAPNQVLKFIIYELVKRNHELEKQLDDARFTIDKNGY